MAPGAPFVETCFFNLGFRHLAGTDAAGANAYALRAAIHDGVDALEIRIPAAARLVIRVADLVAKLRSLATN